MRSRKGAKTLGGVFVMVAIAFIIIATLAGATAFMVHQRVPENVTVIRDLMTRCFFSLGLAVIAAACAMNWLKR